MANINRDYLIINDVKKSNVKLDNGSMNFYITDKNTQNIFVNLVINTSKNELITKYANIENADDYTVTMNIVKPDNTYKVLEGQLHSREEAIFEFDLPADCCDQVGTYRCELLTKCNINSREEITTSNKVSYKVKASVLNDLDDIVDAPEYPLVIQLFDKLSDIDQYEEDRRANELARQLAEEQRQQRFDTLIKALEIDNEERDSKIANLEANDIVQNNKLNNLEAENAVAQNEIATIKSKNEDQDRRLDVAENRLDNINTNIENVLQPTVQRVDAIEAVNVTQNNRLDAIEAKNSQQDDRLLDIEKVNKKQDRDIKCLFNLHTVDVTEEGNSVYLQNSAEGYCEIDNIQGNTLVNCNKEPDKELILNGNINTSGDNTVTITEGVDGGLVDVSLEGNTLVNVSKTKDSTAITKAYTVETGNHVALQGKYDGKARPNIYGNTLVNLYDISKTVPTDQCYIENNAIKITTTSNRWSNFFNAGKDVIKPSTVYTLILNIRKNTLGSKSLIVLTSFAGSNNEYKDCFCDANNGSLTIPGGKTGILVYKLTSLSDLSSSTVLFRSFFNNVDTIENCEVEMSVILLEGDYTGKPIPDYFEGLQSTFEDNLVTQEMVDNGEEVADNLGKYRVDYKSVREDGTVGSTKTLYLNSPVLEEDTIEEKDGGVYHVHRSELAAYTEGDEASLITDKINTLHGLASPTYELIEQSNLAIPSYANGHLDFTSAVPVKKVDFLPFSEELTYLYANTQYTVQFVSDKAATADITLGGTSLLAQSIVVGLNRITITTPATLVDNKLTINGVGANISKVVVTDTNREFGYFEGMKSVGECEGNVIEIVLQNKNLYNYDIHTKPFGNYLVSHQIYNNGIKVIANNSDVRGCAFIQLSPNEDTYVSIDVTGNGAVSKKLVDNTLVETYMQSGTVKFKLEKGRSYKIELNAGKLYDTEVIYDNIIISKNNYTDFVPHQSNTQQLTHEPLRAVGDTKDRYVLIDGKWYIERKCGVRTYEDGDQVNYKTDLVNTTYPLESPTYEPIDYNPLEVYSGTTHITTNSVIPTNITVKNHGFNCLLKPSTAYTVSSNLGLNTVTTGSDIGDSCLRFMDTDTSDVTTMKNVLVLEGDWATKPHAIPANFSGMESAFEQELVTDKADEHFGKYRVNAKVAGKNKLNIENGEILVGRALGQHNGTYADSSKNTIVNVKVNPNTQYCATKIEWGWYLDKNKNKIGSFSKDIITPSNCYYLSITYLAENQNSIQLEQGNTASAYEPYKENNITFYINEPLRGIGDVKDKVYVKDDKVVVQRNCGIRAYEDGDFGTYLTDKVNTVYPLASPTYEEVEYVDDKLMLETFKNSTLSYNSNAPVTSKLYYTYSVPLVDAVTQTADISDQQDAMIIDMATQVAVMEMLLM